MTIYENKPGIFRESDNIIKDVLEKNYIVKKETTPTPNYSQLEKEFMNSNHPFFQL